MNPLSYLTGIGAALLVLVVIVEMLRRRAIKERQAVWWFFAGVVALIFAVFPPLTHTLANLTGVELPINLVFFVAIVLLVLVSLQSSVQITRLERKVERLAEEVAIARARQPERGSSDID